MQLDDAPKIGNYRLLLKLGQGAMGDVHLALAEGLVGFAKLSVLKVLRRHLCDDPDFVAMFLEEGRLSMRLAHPNVVQTYEVGTADGRHFLAMEYLEGQTLASVLNRMGRDNPSFDFAAQAHVLVEVLAAMDYAHEYLDYDGSPLAIVHRDLSPPNVFITYDGRIKVLDFGIAKALDSSLETKTGLILGKTAYMAPEQARGRELDARADIYAIGVMLWEAVARRRRWEGTAEAQIILSLASDEMIDLPGATERGLPARLDDIIERALAPDPADRYPNSRAFRVDLEEVLSQLGPPVDGRALGRTVAEAFKPERDRIRREVEQLLGDYVSSSKPPSAAPDATRALDPAPKLPSLAPKRSEETSLVPMTTGAMRVPVRRSRRHWLTAAAITSIVAGAYLFGTKAQRTDPAVSGTTSSPVAHNVRLQIEAFPREARLFVDGERLPNNPASIDRTSDDALHVVRAELDGFEPLSRTMRFQNDATMSMDLKALRAGAAEPIKSTVAEPAPPPNEPRRIRSTREPDKEEQPVPDSAPSSSSKRAPSVKLDLDNPW